MPESDEISRLEERAARLQGLLEFAPRAFVIEFAGTPKAGKSTSVEAIRHFFSRNNFRVYVLAERAGLCPIPMKGHLFFNTWCTSSMLAELLAHVETETDILIVDRGMFDALVWLELQERRAEVTAQEARTIESFVLLDRWRTLIDLAVVMHVEADEAMRREHAQRLSRKTGSIMNPDLLKAVTEAVRTTIDRHRGKFRALIDHQTTGRTLLESNVILAGRVLDRLEEFLNPEILVVPRRELAALPLDHGGAFGREMVEKAFACISRFGHFMRRDEAEKSAENVQIIPSGLLKHADQVFLFQRKENDPKYRLYGRTTIWQGTHVPRGHSGGIVDLMRTTLVDRVTRSLFLNPTFPVEPLGYCWDSNAGQSSRHFGLIYEIRIDNAHTAADLRRKEFRRQRGHGLVGQFASREVIEEKRDDLNLESWSRTILDGRSRTTA